MRKIVLGQDISILANLDIAMPTITSSITAISFSLLNFAERATFIQISDQKFTKSNYKFNQMERVNSPSKLYQTGNVVELVWNQMLLDVWDEEDRNWEDIGF